MSIDLINPKMAAEVLRSLADELEKRALEWRVTVLQHEKFDNLNGQNTLIVKWQKR
jgi:hypothetical protein